MTYYDKLFTIALMLAFMLPQAIYQARRFKRQLTISHAWHAVYRSAWCLVVAAIFWDLKALVLAGACSMNYSELLNAIRRLPFGYHGDAWFDRVEVWVTGGRVWVVRCIYIILLVVLFWKL